MDVPAGLADLSKKTAARRRKKTASARSAESSRAAQGRKRRGGEDMAVVVSPTGTQQHAPPKRTAPRLGRSRAKPGRRKQRKAHSV
jgi:hypothetical protein